MSETNETNGVAGVIDVVSLYPKDMNIYGDSGNVLTVARRLALYGYAPRIHEINQGDPWPEHVDMILGGGGDCLIILHMPRYRPASPDVLCLDHPYECGFVTFEKAA